MSLTYGNPRLHAVIENWPSGAKRVQAIFEIETTNLGQRARRTTTGAPKVLTYAKQMRIVDGSDGRTYVAALSNYGHITIWRGDMKYLEEVIYELNPRYPALRALFN
jgi:hypothetical protein